MARAATTSSDPPDFVRKEVRSPPSSSRHSRRDPTERSRSDDYGHNGGNGGSRSREDRRIRSRSRERNRYESSRRYGGGSSHYFNRERRYRRSPSRSRSSSRERKRRRRRGRSNSVDRSRRRGSREGETRSRRKSPVRDEQRTSDGARGRSSSKSSSDGRSSPSPSRSRSRSEQQIQSQQAPQALPQQQQSQQPVPQAAAAAPPAAQVVLPAAIAAQLPVVLRMPQMPQITKPARRVYVGGLPAVVDEARIATFFNHAMAVIEGNTFGRGGDAVVSVFIDHAKNYAFVEMRSVEEASNAMALDGIMFEGCQVRIRRPSNYNPEHAMLFGSSQPSPALRLDKVGLVYRAHADGPDRIFIGGLPYEWGEPEVRQLLEPFGPLRALDIVKDSYTRKSKGYGFAVYDSPASTDAACTALNQRPLEGKVLRVHRATNAGGNPALVLLPQSSELGTRVVCLCNAVSEEMLKDDKEYSEIIEDMKEECGKYGPLVSVEVPRGDGVPGLGKVFLEYKDLVSALKARHGLQGRSFDRRTVQATYYPEDKFLARDYGG